MDRNERNVFVDSVAEAGANTYVSKGFKNKKYSSALSSLFLW